MRRSNRFFVLWVALICAVAAAACAINSQPVPPGAQGVAEDGGTFGSGGNDGLDDGGAPPKGTDAGVTGSPPDGGVIYFDGGDAGDGGDEDAGDAGEDAGDGG